MVIAAATPIDKLSRVIGFDLFRIPRIKTYVPNKTNPRTARGNTEISGLITDVFPKNTAVMHDENPNIKPDTNETKSDGRTSANVYVTVKVINAADNGRYGVNARSIVIATNISAPNVA